MKTTVSITEKISHERFGSFGAGVSFELEIDQEALQSRPADVLAQLRYAADLCRTAVTRELELTRQKAEAGQPPDRDAGDDYYEPGDDVAPGDRGYREPPPEHSRRPPDRQPPDRRPPPRDRSGYGRPGPADDPPTTGRQFAGWIAKQDADMHQRVRDLIRAWSLPSRYLDWGGADVQAVYHELTGVPDSGRGWPAAGPARNNGSYPRNGR